MRTDTLMVQGTSSDAGKTTLVAGLGRAFYRRGISVAPFKPQNMALNSAVTSDGGEIGRGQAVQAQACGLQPHTDMNPILLKPSSDTGAQVIVHGHPIGAMQAASYHDYKAVAMTAVLESHRRLCAQYDKILVEGAGSPAEINLRDRDIANMGFAEAVDCPVILIADIDRGGVFAQIVGTLDLLSESERNRVCGFVINRFRGDISLLEDGLTWLEAHTGKPVLGVLPMLEGLHLEAEDAIDQHQTTSTGKLLNVQIPALSRVSNHTDFDALRHHPKVNLQWVGPGDSPGPTDLIILPGSKNVRADLAWLRERGWPAYIERHLRYGGKVLGICGGYQMLGQSVNDPLGIEDSPGSSEGLGWLDMNTELQTNKVLKNASGKLAAASGKDTPATVSGYRIHCGHTTGTALNNPLLILDDGPDGAVSSDNQVAGTYLHGLFDQAESCDALLTWAGLCETGAIDQHALREQQLDRLADAIEKAIDVEKLL